MNKKIAAFAMLLAVAFFLGGCRFAMDEPATKKDRMVGMSLRVYDPGEPDGYDDEGNAYWYPTEEESMPQELTEEEFKALLGGKPRNEWAGVQEYPIGEYYCYIWEKEDETGTTNGCETSWPGPVSIHNVFTDTGEEHELDATVYISAESLGDFVSFHIDPIYRRADGSIYASRDIAGVSGHIDGFSQTVSEETTVTDIDGETETNKVTLTVRYVQTSKTVSAQVLAFDEKHTLLSAQMVTPEKDENGAYSWAYIPEEEAAYLLLEEVLADGTVKHSVADSAQAGQRDSIFTVFMTDEGYFAYPCNVYLAQE